MKEILRVLKPGGTLLIVAESCKKGTYSKLQWPVMKLLRFSNLGVDDHRALFLAAGYSDVQILTQPAKGWICGIGKKPLADPPTAPA